MPEDLAPPPAPPPPAPTIRIVSPEGHPIEVPATEQQYWMRQGYTPDTAATQAARAGAEARLGDLSTAGAIGQGVARTVTLGASDLVQRLAGGEDARIHLQQLREAHPEASLGGELGGMLLPWGAASTVGRIGRGIAELGEGAGVLGRLGAAAAGGAAEGVAYGAGQTVSDLAVENVSSSLSSNLLYGGGLGAGLGAAGKLAEIGLQKARGAVQDFAARQSAALDLQRTGAVPDEQLGQLDRRGLDAAKRTELDAIEAARVPQRDQLAADIGAAREQSKADKLWLSLKESGPHEPEMPAVTPPARPTTGTAPWVPGDIVEMGPGPKGPRPPPFEPSAPRPEGPVTVKKIGRNEMEATTPSGATRRLDMSERQQDDFLNDQLPPGFKSDGLAVRTSRDFSIQRGVPANPAAIEPNALYVAKPSELAARRLFGNGLETADRTAKQYVDSVEQAWKEGKRLDQLTGYVKPDGSVYIEDGNHRLQAAARSDRPVAIQFKDGTRYEPQGGAREIGERIKAELPKATTPPPAAAPAKLSPADARAVREAGKLSFEADRRIDRILRNPKDLAENLKPARSALRQEENALQQMADLSDRLRPTFAGDTRGAREAALDKIPAALERNRDLQRRLTGLMADPASDRLSAIEAALDALRTGRREPSIGTKLLGHVAYGATSAIVGHVPVLGHILGPVLGSKVADIVTGAAGKLGAAAKEQSVRAANAAASFLDVAAKGAARAPLATRVLAGLRYGPPGEKQDEEQPRDLASLFKRRTDELKRQVQIAPDGSFQMTEPARVAMAKNFDGIRPTDPILADRCEAHAATRCTYLASQVPRMPDAFASTMGPLKWQPSDLEMRSFARKCEAAEDPMAVLERVTSGHITPEDVQTMIAVYPEIRNQFIQEVSANLGELRRTLPYERKLAMSMFTGIPVDPAMTPSVLSVLQSQFADEAGSMGGTQAPKAAPQFGSVSKSLDLPTPAQTRAEGLQHA